jgi:hypothetical protein
MDVGTYLTDGRRLVEIVSVETTYLLVSDCAEPVDDPALGRLPLVFGHAAGWREVVSGELVRLPKTRKEAA